MLLALSLTALSGCSSPATNEFEYFRIRLGDQDTLGVSGRDKMIRAVVVYFHPADANEFVIGSDPHHRDLVSSLVDAGFAVVSGHAGGNAWGNPASQHDYLALAGVAADHYHTQNIYFLAESMGTLAAVNIMAMGVTPRLRGMAAINPVLDLNKIDPRFADDVSLSYERKAFEDSNPIALPVNALSGRKIKFFVDKSDATVNADSNAFAFQRRFGGVADISIVACTGDQGSSSCYQGANFVEWFAALERRN